jgi:hypothetical protein
MVGYQLRYGETYRQQHGVVRFEPLDIGSIPGRFVFTDGDFNFPSHGREDEWDAQFLPGPSGRTFHVFVIPQGFPFFPWNLLVTRPSFYADQTGKIRAIQVHSPRPCPPDGPVVDLVTVNQENAQKTQGQAPAPKPAGAAETTNE